MRITNRMMSNSFMTDMNNNLENLDRIRQQLTSGKNFSKPSHDPAGVIRSMQLYSGIDANKQYNKNINNVINWLDVTDTALAQVGKQLGTIRDKLLAAGDAGYGETERKAIKDEINEVIGSISQTLNTTFDGKYIFSGTRVSAKPTEVKKDATTKNNSINYVNKDGTMPLDPTDDEYKQMQEKLKAEISEGVIMEYNVTAKEVLEDSGVDLRELLKNIVNHLDGKNDDGTAADVDAIKNLVTKDLANIDKVNENLLKVRAEVGAKQNRMDAAKEMNTETNFNMKEILSHIEDIDVVEKNMEYAILQSVYISSLQTSAKVLQPTLMDYLR
ncbi:TPA: flagellar hook-associated protein FlgL [Clostridium sporogenes]|uniref:flagellar hook-associated protein FlgL n=1 Tax=Clostridium botulinum TaxID=1491 RepID=UPI000D134F4D|nr:flagellar hook-associated protein FlgL [Clostridium botulinum]AVQ44424.1 flagellar hook-associated protein 3 [Clostridium botulinum]AVQ47967.1 flagellar hook-associated protein 3 [Clostridium botulinum]